MKILIFTLMYSVLSFGGVRVEDNYLKFTTKKFQRLVVSPREKFVVGKLKSFNEQIVTIQIDDRLVDLPRSKIILSRDGKMPDLGSDVAVVVKDGEFFKNSRIAKNK